MTNPIDEFPTSLRLLLNHIYNLDILSKSPLIKAFHLEKRGDAPLALQKIVMHGIEALKPVIKDPPGSDRRRIYDILYQRYIEQFQQDEVAHNLGMSIRHFRREQGRAIEALAYHLIEAYQLAEGLSPGGKESQPTAVLTTQDGLAEWDWVRDNPPGQLTNLPAAVEEISHLLDSLAGRLSINLNINLAEDLGSLAVYPVVFRQIMLNNLTKVMEAVSPGEVQVLGCRQNNQVEINILGHPARTSTRKLDDRQRHLYEITEELVTLCKGQISIQWAGDELSIQVFFPLPNSLPVLVVDDNPEIIELLKRYAADSHYSVIGITDPAQAVDMAICTGARLVILDVMMPGVDGWELLGRFHRHPETMTIPVIVLSILAQKELALSLGACELIAKPVTQEVFLQALEAHVSIED